MPTSGNPWQVQIRGWISDLEHLARHFTSGSLSISKDERDGGFVYESQSFGACSTSRQVLAIASEEFSVLSGILRLTRESHEPLRVGAVYKRNAAGGRDVFVDIRETLQVRAEIGEVSVTVTDAQGNVITKSVQQPPPRSVALAKIAAADVSVAKVMRLLASEDAKSWVGMYRIHEVVEADAGGEHALKKRGWGSPRDLKRFKRSANSVKAAGDAARHGIELNQPPQHPMSVEEAGAYLIYVVHAWLRSKGA